MRKLTVFCITAFVSFSVVLFQNCGGKKFAIDTNRPVKPINPNGYIGGNGQIRIIVNEYPKDSVRSDDGQVVDFEVIAINSSLQDVECKLDGDVIECEKSDRIELKDLELGEHTFEITGTNIEDQSATEVIKWTLYNKIATKVKDIPISSGRTADIIINVDNSYSMADIQQNMASRISNLLNKLTKLDSYNIAVITSEPSSNNPDHAAHVDGMFNKFSNNSYCLTKSTANATILGNLVQREESLVWETSGNGYERPIFTTYRAFERSLTANSNEDKCLRPNVPKHVIVISDENESKYKEDGQGGYLSPLQNLSYIEKSDGANLIKMVSTAFGASSFKFHSIIINPFTTEGQACLETKQEFSPNSKFGTDFAKLSQLTGGVTGSVCAADYSSQLQVIGESIVDTQKVYGLDCVAVEQNGSKGSVKRLSNNATISGFSIDGANIEFTQDLSSDTYRVTYYCFE